jgi:hypothetical protein
MALSATGTPAALAAGTPPKTTPSIQIEVVQPGGFHWQDAAVGCLAAIGLTFVVVGLRASREAAR